MKYPLIFFGLLGIVFLLPSCSDVLEKDLKDEQVIMNAPVHELATATQSQTFWWEELDEVIDGYRLEIVSPSFDAVEALILQEEIIDATTFDYTLAPGIYQWAVIAFNSTSETKPVIYNLTITGDSTMNLSNQVINLVSPENGFSTSESEINFLWQSLENVTDYKIQIASPDFSNSTFILDDQLLQIDNYTTTLAEGDYAWRVRGENDQSVTPFSQRSFRIDMTAPSAPVLTSPAFGDTLSLPITLNWDVDSGSIMDTLYVFEDSLVSEPILQIAITNTSYIFNETASDVYFWRLRSVDAAGNTSDFSSSGKFYVE